jgi:hypothetical protein
MNRSKIGQGKVSLGTFFSIKESTPGVCLRLVEGAEHPKSKKHLQYILMSI